MLEIETIFKLILTYEHSSRIPAKIFSDIKETWREPVFHFPYKDQFLQACAVTSNVFSINGDLTMWFKVFAEINHLYMVTVYVCSHSCYLNITVSKPQHAPLRLLILIR